MLHFQVAQWLRSNGLLAATLSAVVLGIVLGVGIRYAHPSSLAILLISFPGEILLNMLKLLILPLVISSLIAGLSQMEVKSAASIAFWACAYYVVTTALAVTVGIILVLLIQPGDPSIRQKWSSSAENKDVTSLDTLLDLIRNFFPENLFQATMEQVRTKHTTSASSGTNGSIAVKNFDVGQLEYTRGMNMLGIIVFCVIFGIICASRGQKVKPVTDLFIALDHIVTCMVRMAIWYSPVGIVSLIAGNLLRIDDLSRTAQSLGMYMLTVAVGLAIHFSVTLPLVYFIVVRKNPLKFLRGMIQAMLTALGTASSAATLPVTFQCLQANKIDSRVTRFVLPIGATINMDGTALYEAVASIFIAQLNGISLSFPQVLLVSITATLASIGAASVPGAGLITIIIVLNTVGLPTDDISLIITVDWLLDRLRTCVNVIGDAYGAAVVGHLCRDKLTTGGHSIAFHGTAENGPTIMMAVRSITDANTRNGQPTDDG
ncbi:excitatory amino acid transporter [Trichuris trichiura]|uniref:Amino acid transporter n=1 Tax=Trichuris trichiura TaxID=36087 RepID=A0A077ZGD9_TRITR|nr:excitatory amino acid transporter [Trichuris trichiura]